MTSFKQLQAKLPAMWQVQLTLYSLPLIDEIVSTVPVLALPLLRTEMGLTYSQVGWLFTMAGLSAWLVEPGINAASDHWPKPRIILTAMLGMVIALALAGSSPTFLWLLIAFLLMGASNGPILGIGQAFLIDSNLTASLRTMTRWTLMAALGDLAGPALIAAAFAFGMGWRGLFWASALLWLLAFIALRLQRLPATSQAADGEPAPPLTWRTVRDNLVVALRTPLLLRWLLLVLLPTFLDEMFLAFATLLLQDHLGLTPATISMAVSVHVAGSLLGLLALERVGQRFPPQQLLAWLALVVLAGLLLFIMAPNALWAMLALFVTGLGVSGWYPIAAAEAYRALPGRSGTVRALYALAAPLEAVVPLLIGLVAERWGIQAGVALLLLAPVAVLLVRPRNQPATAALG